ncbi:GtrA family protein [Euzebya sp.]|uniref:GtrA family protein n=1 Tax=Euzebya sp. TaxID=1971409 RepID=UPI003513780A
MTTDVPISATDPAATPAPAADAGGSTLLTRLWRFLVVGGSSAVIDLGLLIALRELAGLHIPVATTIAFWTGLLYNFSLNRVWSFDADRVGVPFAKYLIVVGLNYLLTLAIVTGGHEIGVAYAVAKVFAQGLGACFTFVAYDRWVFR